MVDRLGCVSTAGRMISRASEPRLSVIVPVRNELPRLPTVMASIDHQRRKPDEVIVAEGMSTDGSRAWLQTAAQERPWLTILDNPARVIPTALNIALAAASGDLVARMDTHFDYDPDYLDRLVQIFISRPEVVGAGGAMATAGRGPWGHAIAATLRRRIGLGGAPHRAARIGGPIAHVSTGCYRRHAVLDAGGYDERLLANEDFELDIRLQERGGVLWLEPSARSTWFIRESLPALSRQMWRYGHHKALTLLLHPRSLKARQLAPPVLVAGLASLLLIRPRVGAAAAAAYFVGAGVAGAGASWADGASSWRGALVPPVVHLSWGAGLLTGLARFARHREPTPTVPRD